MSDKPDFPQIPEGAYLDDFFTGQRLTEEQKRFDFLRHSLFESHPNVEHEGANPIRPWSKAN